MEKIGDFEIRHPVLTGAALAVLMAYSAWGIYSIGRKIGFVRACRGMEARAVSEALGG